MPDRDVIRTDKAPRAVGPYSQAIVSGGFVFTAGQIPLDPATGKIVEGDFKAEVRQVLNNVSRILEAAGTSLEDAVKFTVFVTNLGRFSELNNVFSEYFKTDPPARSVLQVSELPLGADVEIECIAAL